MSIHGASPPSLYEFSFEVVELGSKTKKDSHSSLSSMRTRMTVARGSGGGRCEDLFVSVVFCLPTGMIGGLLCLPQL